MVLPRRTMGSKAYAARAGLPWHLVEPAAPIVRRPPRRFGSLEGDLMPLVSEAYPEMGVLELQDAYLVGPNGWVVTRDGFLLPDQSRYFRTVDDMVRRHKSSPITRLRGTVISLATDSGYRNYGHYLYDGLGRAALLERAGIDLARADHLYVGVPHPRASRLLERLGVAAERIVPAARDEAIRADVVITTTFPGAARDHPRWVIDFLRRKLLPEGTSAERRRRLYAVRTASRRLANEAEVWPLLESRGFEWYDPIDRPDPPADFAQAEAVFGVHGANLADICFCLEGARVLELTPTDHINSYWYAQAETAGLEFGHIVCRSIDQRAPGANRRGDRDVYLEPSELREALDGMGL